MRYKEGDPVWIRSDPLTDRYPAVIELILNDGYTVHWIETDQHVRVPEHAVVGLREVDPEEDPPEECDSCRFKTTQLHHVTNRIIQQEHDVCTLCYSTMTSTALQYPDQFPQAEVMRTICYVGNAILQAIVGEH